MDPFKKFWIIRGMVMPRIKAVWRGRIRESALQKQLKGNASLMTPAQSHWAVSAARISYLYTHTQWPQAAVNTAQTVCEYTHCLSSDCTKELLTGTLEKVKEISGWEGGRVRKTICLPFILWKRAEPNN